MLCAERGDAGVTVFPGPAGPASVADRAFAGSASEVREQKGVVLALGPPPAALAHRAARTRAEAEALWAVRRKCSGAMFELGDAKLNEDIVVPMRNYGKFARFLEKLRRESKLPIPTFGHLGDGNLHVNIMYHKAVPAECRAAERAVQKLMETVGALQAARSPASMALAWRRLPSCACSIHPRKCARCAP